MTSIPEALQAGLEHHRAGRLLQAEQMYRRVLQIHPRHAGAVHLLGLIAFQAGKLDVAEYMLQEVVKIDAFHAPYSADLGEVYRALGKTSEAIAAYRKAMGIQASSEIDDDLLELLAVDDTTAGIKPKPPVLPAVQTQMLPDNQVPVPSDPMPKPEMISARIEGPAATGPDPMIMKIQAGLKAFGNDKMDIDGMMGAKTRAALREFQSLFGLEVTGEPSREVYAKMQEIGLTN